MLEGGCLCGEVRYRIDGPVFRMSHCHCSMCRKAHGAAFGTYLNARATDFAFVRGGALVGRHASSADAVRTFCTRCGSPLQWLGKRSPERVGVAAGTLDDDPGLRPEFHLYVGSRAAWDRLPDDGLPRHEGPDSA